MFDELNVYDDTDHFFFKDGNVLSKVCNAPERAGVYLVYQLRHGKVDLVYIGASGTINQDGTFKNQLLKGRINNTHDGIKRQALFENKIREFDIDALDIYWYVTYDEAYNDFPNELEDKLLEKHKSIYGKLPGWNKR